MSHCICISFLHFMSELIYCRLPIGFLLLPATLQYIPLHSSHMSVYIFYWFVAHYVIVCFLLATRKSIRWGQAAMILSVFVSFVHGQFCRVRVLQLFGCDIFVYESTETRKFRISPFVFPVCTVFSVRSVIFKSDNC
jgi:hypothetical protein